MQAQLNHTFHLGKTSLIGKLPKSKHLQDLAAMFFEDNVTKEQIGSAGVEIFLKRYRSILREGNGGKVIEW